MSTEKTGIIIGLSAVIVSVANDEPKVFILRGADDASDALPFGPFDPDTHPTLDIGLRRWVREQTPLTPGYVEQLYTFGNRGRYAGQKQDGPRVVSIGYLALTAMPSDSMCWGDWYHYFPWEDWRRGKPKMIGDAIEPGLMAWVNAADDPQEKSRRRARVNACFGPTQDEEKVLERYELLYEARLVFEAARDKNIKVDDRLVPGRSMLYDHRRILATAIGRLRGKLKYRPVVFELMPAEFTLLQLQKTVEAISGHALHKQNFRRLVESSGMVEEIPGKKSSIAGGRPAALFCFRPAAMLERSTP